ncbi:hypothetical protein K438DRAFT_1756043 [Mycena galopus ATCC 62051]|nr:hypothetical protein K438DRAFT_1756043 [Mycena galopus ATCC 62051]
MAPSQNMNEMKWLRESVENATTRKEKTRGWGAGTAEGGYSGGGRVQYCLALRDDTLASLSRYGRNQAPSEPQPAYGRWRQEKRKEEMKRTKKNKTPGTWKKQRENMKKPREKE